MGDMALTGVACEEKAVHRCSLLSSWYYFIMIGLAQKNISLINSYANQLSSALVELDSPAAEHEIEAIAIFLVRAMGSESRSYHRPEHSLDVSREQPPIARISALFHDLVYVQVDPNWKIFLGDVLFPMIPNDSYSLNVREALTKTSNTWFKICAVIFGFEKEEQLLPLGGLNEFLSALVLINKLEVHLTPKDLLKTIACIEATIPFRTADSIGHSPSHRLRKRLIKASLEFNLNINTQDINHVTIDCRCLVEKDLIGFSAKKLGFFLSDSWNVLSENHASLRNNFFLISDYQKAVFELIFFFQMLDPDNMFWNDVAPTSPQSAVYALSARYNLKNGTEYMKAFFLSLSLLEAIALETGGETPYELFVGAKKSSREHEPQEISDYLNLEDHPSMNSTDERDVYSVLKNGRVARAKFDRKDCPIGAFLYLELHRGEQFEIQFQNALCFYKGELKGKDFIKTFPPKVIAPVLHALSQLVTTRVEQILALT